MALGGPLAFVLGGGPDPAEAAYRALKSAVGVGFSAPGEPYETQEGSWRWARARGLAAVVDDLKVLEQSSPEHATDLLRMYSELLSLFFPGGAPEAEQQRELAARWVRAISAAGPSVEAIVEAVDPTASVQAISHTITREAQPGRAFEDWDPSSPKASGPAFAMVVGNPRETAYPNYSDEYKLYVNLPLGAGVMTPQAARALRQLGEELDEALPAWVDYQLYTHVGFVLDLDLLDVTAFGS